MKYLIVSGSVRKDSQSLKVSKYVKERLEHKVGADHSVTILNLAEQKLPLWDEEFFGKSGHWGADWPPVENALKSADAFIFVVPEWHGMVPPPFKNLLFLAGHNLAHKPALITTVSSGMGGAYVVSELRSSAYKNNLVNFMPEQLVLRNILKMLNPGPAVDDTETSVRERIDHTLTLLKIYAEAFRSIRESGEVDFGKYPNGM